MIQRKIAMGFFWAVLAVALHVWPMAPGARAQAPNALRPQPRPWLRALLLVFLFFLAGAGRVAGQGSRKDDIVFNSRGASLAGATVRVCVMPASGQPCTPLAQIFSDAALTQALTNPTTTDGLGNYSFYAAPGKYEIELSGPGITTKQIPNVILPSDPTSPSFSSVTSSGAISAFSLNLTGNLTVNGNTTAAGNLTATAGQNTTCVDSENGRLYVNSTAACANPKYPTLQSAYNACPSAPTKCIIVDTRDKQTITDTLAPGSSVKDTVIYAAGATYAPTGGQLVSIPADVSGGLFTLICPYEQGDYFTVTGHGCVIQDQTNGVAGIAIANAGNIRIEGFSFEGGASTGAHIAITGGLTPNAAAWMYFERNSFQGKDNCLATTGVTFLGIFEKNQCYNTNLSFVDMNNNGNAASSNWRFSDNWFNKAGATGINIHGANGFNNFNFYNNSVQVDVTAAIQTMNLTVIANADIRGNDFEPRTISGTNTSVTLSGASINFLGNTVVGPVLGATLTSSFIGPNRIVHGGSAGSFAITLDSASVGNIVMPQQTDFAAMLFQNNPQNNNICDSVANACTFGMAVKGLSLGRSAVTLVNGANENIAVPVVNGTPVNFISISGPSGAFSLGGFTGGREGQVLYVFNATGQAMSINNLDGGSSGANQIFTLTGGNVAARSGQSFAKFIYETADNLWLLTGVGPNSTLVASGTSTLANGALTTGTCASVVTTAATGAATTDAIEWSFASAANTSDGRLNYTAWTTSGNVNFQVCNGTAGSLTPSGLAVNWRVIR